MDIRKTELKHFITLGIVAMIFVASPSFIQRARVINFKKTMSIQTSKIDPPRLAFDEVYSDEKSFLNEWDLLKSKEGTFLKAGDSSVHFVGRSPVQVLKNQKVVLRPMTFTRQEVEQQQQDLAWVDQLPRSAQNRVLASQEKYGTLDEDWAPPTYKELASQKIKQVIQELDSQKASELKPKIIVQSLQPDGSVLTEKSIQTASVEVRNNLPHSVSGMIEVKGLPSGSSQWQVHLARYENGVKKEDGAVNLRKSTYSITVPSLSGSIVAQMVDTKSGLVIGEGSIRLSQYSKEQLSGNARLVIEKAHHEVATNMGSFYNSSSSLMSPPARKEKPIATRVLLASLDTEGRTDESGTFRFEQVQNGSWTLLRTEAKNFHPGLYLVQSGKEKRLPLFPSSMIQALKQIIRDQTRSSEVAETGSIVWGQVVQDGKPLAGAEVDVEFLDSYRPVYFNSLLIPDPQLKATSENGYFAFVHLPAGFHSLVATNGHAYLSHSNVVVDNETVSIAQLESSLQTEKTDIKVFDSFSGQPLHAQLEMQSLPAALEVHGFAEIQLAPISRLSFMKVQPNDSQYMTSLQIYDDNTDSIHVPMVRFDWLQDIASSRKMSSIPDTGVVVGFVPFEKYEVYLGHHSRFPTDNIIYFDVQGNVSQTSSPGGGFIIMNVPAGVQSVVVVNNETSLLQTQILPVDTASLSVLKFR